MTGQVVVALYVWRVPGRAVPRALARLATDRFRLRASPGLRFGKLLGTGTGTGFGPTDVDATRFAAFTVFDDEAAADRFDAGAVARGWAGLARTRARLRLRPLSSRGRWSGRDPFQIASLAGRDGGEGPTGRWGGLVLALTRARLRVTRAPLFWRAIPPVAAEVAAAPGVLARFGIGEAPIGWQGTISIWRSTADLVHFAYRQPQHRTAIARTATARWYAEELFARFAVCEISGDRAVLGWGGDEEGTGSRG